MSKRETSVPGRRDRSSKEPRAELTEGEKWVRKEKDGCRNNDWKQGREESERKGRK